MTAVTFEPTDLAQLADPYPALAALRRVAAIVRLRSGFWAVNAARSDFLSFQERTAGL